MRHVNDKNILLWKHIYLTQAFFYHFQSFLQSGSLPLLWFQYVLPSPRAPNLRPYSLCKRCVFTLCLLDIVIQFDVGNTFNNFSIPKLFLLEAFTLLFAFIALPLVTVIRFPIIEFSEENLQTPQKRFEWYGTNWERMIKVTKCRGIRRHSVWALCFGNVSVQYNYQVLEPIIYEQPLD